MELISAIDEYERCKVIYDHNEISSAIEAIKVSKEYKSQIAKREETAVLESEIKNSILNQFDKELEAAKSDNNFKFWKTEMKKLDDRKKSNDIAVINMVDRIQSMTNALAYETAQVSKRNLQNDKLEYCVELAKVLQSYNKK